jgi:hypothetical protein
LCIAARMRHPRRSSCATHVRLGSTGLFSTSNPTSHRKYEWIQWTVAAFQMFSVRRVLSSLQALLCMFLMKEQHMDCASSGKENVKKRRNRVLKFV